MIATTDAPPSADTLPAPGTRPGRPGAALLLAAALALTGLALWGWAAAADGVFLSRLSQAFVPCL